MSEEKMKLDIKELPTHERSDVELSGRWMVYDSEQTIENGLTWAQARATYVEWYCYAQVNDWDEYTVYLCEELAASPTVCTGW